MYNKDYFSMKGGAFICGSDVFSAAFYHYFVEYARQIVSANIMKKASSQELTGEAEYELFIKYYDAYIEEQLKICSDFIDTAELGGIYQIRKQIFDTIKCDSYYNAHANPNRELQNRAEAIMELELYRPCMLVEREVGDKGQFLSLFSIKNRIYFVCPPACFFNFFEKIGE